MPEDDPFFNGGFTHSTPSSTFSECERIFGRCVIVRRHFPSPDLLWVSLGDFRSKRLNEICRGRVSDKTVSVTCCRMSIECWPFWLRVGFLNLHRHAYGGAQQTHVPHHGAVQVRRGCLWRRALRQSSAAPCSWRWTSPPAPPPRPLPSLADAAQGGPGRWKYILAGSASAYCARITASGLASP